MTVLNSHMGWEPDVDQADLSFAQIAEIKAQERDLRLPQNMRQPKPCDCCGKPLVQAAEIAFGPSIAEALCCPPCARSYFDAIE